ncbi:MAG: hypothetical protein WKF96_21415 [Solirubrobacteraceae bacterium]
MSRPVHGAIYRFTKTGAVAAFVLVLSENDYNAVTRDVVIVPIFADEAMGESDAAVRVSLTHIAHCTRVTTVLQEDLELSRRGITCPPQVLARIKRGICAYLSLQRLVERTPAPPVETTRDTWWPRQSAVHYAPLEALDDERKLFAVISEDDWNSRPGSRYSTGVKLTSKGRSPEHWRAPLEVPVPGGVAVSGHLYLLVHAAMSPKSPNPPRPAALDDEQMAQLAAKTADVLSL